MRKRFQLGWATLAVIGFAVLSGAIGGAVMAQQSQNHPDRPPQRQQPAPRPQTQRPSTNHPNASRAPAQQTGRQPSPAANRPAERLPERRSERVPNRTSEHQANQRQLNNEMNGPPNRNENRPNRPPSATNGPARSNNFRNSNDFSERPNENRPGATLRPRQQAGVGAQRPFVDRMRELTPQQRDRVLQNSKAFQNLAPEQQGRIRQQFNQWDHLNGQQRADLRAKEDTWRRMTPEQREHIKNDVLPKWRQIPWERQQAIQQKLGVLQNMPESARNRRLSDPNFTRGMSDEDKATLHDLSHLHVGGAPDPPGNE